MAMKYQGTIILTILNTGFFLLFLLFPNLALFNALIQQNSAILGGEWWRIVTAFWIEDDWVWFIQSIAFLLYLGITFEKAEDTRWWNVIAWYVFFGLTSNVAALFLPFTGDPTYGCTICLIGISGLNFGRRFRAEREVGFGGTIAAGLVTIIIVFLGYLAGDLGHINFWSFAIIEILALVLGWRRYQSPLTKICPLCECEIAANATSCPNCNEPL